MDGGISLGALLRRRREELGLSTYKVSARLDRLGVRLSPSQVRRIENGAMPRSDQLAGLCRIYDLAPQYLHDVILVTGNRAVRVSDRDRSIEDLLREGVELAGRGLEDRARARFAAALGKALSAGDAAAASRARIRLAWMDVRQGYWASVIFRCAEVLNDEAAEPRDRDVARCFLLRAFSRGEWIEIATRYAPVVEAIATDRKKDSMLRGTAWSALARFHRLSGDVDRTIEAARRAARLYGRSEARPEKIRAVYEIADVLHAAGRDGEALRELRALERETRKAAFRGGRLGVLWRLGRALGALGRADAAIPFLEEAEELAEELHQDGIRFRTRYWLAEAFQATGHENRAAELEEWLLDEARRQDDRWPEVRAVRRWSRKENREEHASSASIVAEEARSAARADASPMAGGEA